MTIQERKEIIIKRLVWADQRIATLTMQNKKDFRKKAESELEALLNQVAKEQRERFEVAIESATGSTELIDTIYKIMPELKPEDT